jgi:hypothetical protein
VPAKKKLRKRLLNLVPNILEVTKMCRGVVTTQDQLDKLRSHDSVFVIGSLVERKAMLPNLPTSVLDYYFDLAEHLALRTSLLIFLVLALYRVIEREWRKR